MEASFLMRNVPALFPGTPGPTAAQESHSLSCERSEVSAGFHLLEKENKNTSSLLNVLFIPQTLAPEASSLPAQTRVPAHLSQGTDIIATLAVFREELWSQVGDSHTGSKRR